MLMLRRTKVPRGVDALCSGHEEGVNVCRPLTIRYSSLTLATADVRPYSEIDRSTGKSGVWLRAGVRLSHRVCRVFAVLWPVIYTSIVGNKFRVGTFSRSYYCPVASGFHTSFDPVANNTYDAH